MARRYADGVSATRTIREAIAAADADLVARQPWLGRVDAVALALFLGAWVWMGAAAALWGLGGLPGWATVPLIALGLSVLHELEHDLIHRLYFQGRRRLYHAVMAGIWLGKCSLDPWSRGASTAGTMP